MTIRIQDVIDVLTAGIDPISDRVDTLKFGEPLTEVKGIAVTFMATQRVLEQAFRLGVNLVITHEGTFFSHHDVMELVLAKDPIYLIKKRFIDETGLAIYRFHDNFHRYQPDGIMEGLVQTLGWQAHITANLPEATLVTLPPMTVEQVAKDIKERLAIDFVRVVGDLSHNCSRIGLLAGYRGGGKLAIPLFEQHNLDLIVYGEGPEWETPEYVRDAVDSGKPRALIVVGHRESEQPGMQMLADRLSSLLPRIPIHYLPVEPVFRVV